MEVTNSKKDNFLVIGVIGRLDTSNYAELEAELLGFIESGEKHIVLDCSGLSYVSSSGLRVMLMALKKTTALNGNFHLCCLHDNIMEIFEIAGFTSIFKIFTNLDDAVK